MVKRRAAAAFDLYQIPVRRSAVYLADALVRRLIE